MRAKSGLTPTEETIFRKLATHPECVVEYEVLERAIWPAGGYVCRANLQTYVSRLRCKIEPERGRGRHVFILNEPGVGYALHPKGYIPARLNEAVVGVARLTKMIAPGQPRRLRAIAAG